MHKGLRGGSVPLLPAVMAVLLLGGSLWGQIADGNLIGAVLDPDGAVIPNASVTAQNVATGVEWPVSADGFGRYQINHLAVGEYTLRVAATGFATTSLEGVAVELSTTTTANVTLTLGPVTETVEVVASSALIDATTAQIANISATRLASDHPAASNPVLGYLNLSLLGAGVASAGGIGAGTGPAVGGQRPRNNNFTVEGTDNNRKDVTGPVISLPNDAVAEFALLQNQFSPEFGHSSGGQFNTVIRSGTNELHGRVYEYLLNRYLNAQDQAFKRQGIFDRQRFDSNLFGGNLGGPIRRNELFFFGNFDYNPIGQSSTGSAPVYAPTEAGFAALAGMPEVSQTNLDVLRQYLGPAAAQSGGRTASVNGAEIPLGVVPILAPNYLDSYRWMASLDYTMSGTDQWRGRYVGNRRTSVDTGAQLPAFYTTRPVTATLVSLSELHSFSATLTNEVRAAYNRYDKTVGLPGASFPGLDVFPNIGFRSDLNLQLGPNANAPQAVIQNTYQLVDNVTWIAGKHEVKLGVDARNMNSSLDFIQRIRGDYQYSNLERYLLDLTPDVRAQRNVGGKPYRGNAPAVYLFANDNWRTTRNLTLTLGLRWEYNGVARSMKEFDQNSIADVPGVITFAAPRAQKTNFAPRIGFAYSPGRSGLTSIRGGFGIAYDQIFDNIGANVRPPQATATIDSPRSDESGYLAAGGILPNAPPPSLDAAQARRFTSGWLPDQQLGYAINWNLGVQHAFAGGYVLDVRYVGTRGVHLLLQTQLNSRTLITPDHSLPTYLTSPSQGELDSLGITRDQLFGEAFAFYNPWAAYGFDGTITSYVPQGNSEYHGLAVELTRRFSRDLMFKTAYTWSHLMDDSTMEVNFTTLSPRRPQNFQDVRSEWASSALDRRHRLTFTWLYDVPWFRANQNWALRNLIGNYSFAGTYTAESPEYVTPQSASDVNLNGDSAGDRVIINPNGIAGTGTDVTPLTNSGGDIVAYLANDPTARYVRGAWGAYANSGRNLLAGRGINNFDVSVIKVLPVGERYRLELRADFYNALNHAQYTPGEVNNISSTAHTNETFYLTPGNPSFGRWDQVYSSHPRVVQLVGKLSF